MACPYWERHDGIGHRIGSWGEETFSSVCTSVAVDPIDCYCCRDEMDVETVVVSIVCVGMEPDLARAEVTKMSS